MNYTEPMIHITEFDAESIVTQPSSTPIEKIAGGENVGYVTYADVMAGNAEAKTAENFMSFK